MAHVRAQGPSCVELNPGVKMLVGGSQWREQLAWKVIEIARPTGAPYMGEWTDLPLDPPSSPQCWD